MAYASIHPQYEPTDLLNDVCLLKLEEPFTEVRNEVEPIEIGDVSGNQSDISCLVAGWGKTETSLKVADLRKVAVRILPSENCSIFHLFDKDTMICAGEEVIVIKVLVKKGLS